ncbi:hypothetical protein SAMN00777080_3437 [Aquiflexum balticum DSM 16537]|uniref:Uncharacterized protein n=1 Tax=Aquiflexum balticum DSM 16537 TaxID=758820 RepID=A0A1W2H7B5_9BACT|nr:hypothetical protein [Aquiflexum balticum]SMD44803.1 hypothetical protein SAMN00777080_3437 [Aquiflexum balticum DSM 16537]
MEFNPNEINPLEKEEDKKMEEGSKDLASFIDENSKLISVLGVFTALTVFSFNLQIKFVGNLLSFVFLTLVILVWVEIWSRFPKKSSSWRLNLFENILSYSILLIVFYWIIFYRDIWEAILVYVLWILIMSVTGHLISYFKLFQRILGLKVSKYKIVRIFIGLIIILPVFFLSFKLAGIIADPLNNLINNVHLEIQNLISD